MLTPLTAMAAVCDTTELNNINQRFISDAPGCIASGSYASDACATVRQIPGDFKKEGETLTRSGCYGGSYREDSRTEEYTDLISALPEYPSNFVKDSTGDSYAKRVCNSLIPMYRTKELGSVTNLVWMRLGDQPESNPILTCMYRAVIPNEKDGDIPVRVMVVYDKAKSSYTLKVE